MNNCLCTLYTHMNIVSSCITVATMLVFQIKVRITDWPWPGLLGQSSLKWQQEMVGIVKAVNVTTSPKDVIFFGKYVHNTKTLWCPTHYSFTTIFLQENIQSMKLSFKIIIFSQKLDNKTSQSGNLSSMMNNKATSHLVCLT